MKKILCLLVICALVGCFSCQNKEKEEQKQQTAGQTEQTAGQTANSAFDEYIGIMQKYDKKVKDCNTCEELKQCVQDKNSDAIDFLQKYGQNVIKELSPEELEKVKQTDLELQKLLKERYEELCK